MSGRIAATGAQRTMPRPACPVGSASHHRHCAARHNPPNQQCTATWPAGRRRAGGSNTSHGTPPSSIDGSPPSDLACTIVFITYQGLPQKNPPCPHAPRTSAPCMCPVPYSAGHFTCWRRVAGWGHGGAYAAAARSAYPLQGQLSAVGFSRTRRRRQTPAGP